MQKIANFWPILIDQKKWNVTKSTSFIVKNGYIYHANAYGCFILELCDGSFSVNDICTFVGSLISETAALAKIKVRKNIIEKSIRKFLLEARKEGLIKWKG